MKIAQKLKSFAKKLTLISFLIPFKIDAEILVAEGGLMTPAVKFWSFGGREGTLRAGPAPERSAQVQGGRRLAPGWTPWVDPLGRSQFPKGPGGRQGGAYGPRFLPGSGRAGLILRGTLRVAGPIRGTRPPAQAGGP